MTATSCLPHSVHNSELADSHVGPWLGAQSDAGEFLVFISVRPMPLSPKHSKFWGSSKHGRVAHRKSPLAE